MDSIITWCTAHWQLISIVALFVVSVLNSITQHFGAGHPRIVPIIGVILEALSFLTSRGTRSSLPGPLGRLKLPLQNVPTPVELVTKRARVSGLTLMCLLLLAGCAHNLEPRRCTHLLGQRGGMALSPWADTDCKRAQVKRDWLVGLTAGLAVAGGAGGIGSLFPDEQRYRLAVGVTSAALAIGAAIVTPFLASAQRNLSDHCVEYHDPMVRGGWLGDKPVARVTVTNAHGGRP
jgi:hypothetical protein